MNKPRLFAEYGRVFDWNRGGFGREIVRYRLADGVALYRIRSKDGANKFSRTYFVAAGSPEEAGTVFRSVFPGRPVQGRPSKLPGKKAEHILQHPYENIII